MSMAVEWFKEGGDTMRELLRSKARAAMQRAGYTRLNKPTYNQQGRGPSVFAQRWREFC